MTDIVIETEEVRYASQIPLQELRAKVSKLERVNEEVMIVHLRTPRSQVLNFLAGQHIRLVFNDLPPRDLPLANCPCDGMRLRVHVLRTRGDAFSEHVFSALAVGQTATISGPRGEFILDEDSRRALMFIAYETGFAPVNSLIEHAIALEMDQPTHVYWLFREDVGPYQANYLRSLQDALDHFAFHDILLKEETQEALTHALETIIGAHPDISDYDIYLSLPDSIYPAIRNRLLIEGLPDQQIRLDQSSSTP